MNEKINDLQRNIALHLVGKEEQIRELLIALLAGGHVLIEDVPGVGKTTLAKALAASVDMSCGRIQFTPDTLPTDVTGVSVYNRKSESFEVVPGPVMNQIVLADEINRTSPKTQAALLEVMEENQVTIDGTSFALPQPFIVIATENPIDTVGTYALPEAELDRFMMRISMGYPDTEDTWAMAQRFLSGELTQALAPVVSAGDILSMKHEVTQVKVAEELVRYVTALIEATRRDPDVRCGASPRAVLILLRAAQAAAYVDGRDFVIPEDVREMARLTLPHRLLLRTEARRNHVDGRAIVERVLSKEPVPGI